MSGGRNIEQLLSNVLDPVWYRARYPDVAASGADPLRHFIEAGLREQRDPNRWFDSAWYLARNPDAAASGAHPLLHYLTEGAARGRDPHPRFDVDWYVGQHPDAAGNPMLYHLRIGAARGWLTEKPVAIADYLPAVTPPAPATQAAPVDVIVPVYRDMELTRRCLESVLTDNDRPPGRIIVIDDRSPEPGMRAYLSGLPVTLIRNKTNLGFVASVNRGMKAAGDHDVVLLNSDTEVPPGWLRRLQAQAHAAPGIASVSPLSNNATICSYLGFEGAPIPPDMTLEALDRACQTANAGRSVETPTTVGFCMFITRAALDDVGLFDEKTFGKGYGEENDFCRRAAAQGWTHRIACDIFVRHEGGASFGTETEPRIAAAVDMLEQRYPDYLTLVRDHVLLGETGPYRFAATMAVFRASGLPVVLAISHDMDGGIRRHIRERIARDRGRAHYLLLEPAARGLALTVPSLPGHPVLTIAAERWREVSEVARSAGVSRVQVHHLMGIDFDVRDLIHALDVPFDLTVHDYFAICPQIVMLPWPSGAHCEEPGPAICDACIANRPSFGASDILSWRLRWAWLFQEAEHVLVPSADALERLRRYGLADRAVLVPHETVEPGPWPMRRPKRPGKRLRVAVIGVLANHKGAHVVASVVLAADPAALEVVLIGDTDSAFPADARARMTVTGRYEEQDLPSLLDKHRPHVVWFPAIWPETYSYTLSAAIEAGLPIAATAIGAQPERLTGRPLTWLIPPSFDPEVWLSLFRTIRATIGRDIGPIPERAAVRPCVLPAPGLVPSRQSGQTTVVAIPDGNTPCAHIRLLRPLDHPVTGAGTRVVWANPDSAFRYRADLIVTQRHAIPTMRQADALAAHARRTGATLVYDLDDDLLDIPPDHPEATALTGKSALVRHMIGVAGIVRTSTQTLADRLLPLARKLAVAPNALDERIWLPPLPAVAPAIGPVRLLYMGTATHDADFALILPALRELHGMFEGQVQVDLIGGVSRLEIPGWIRRLTPPMTAARSYAGFVHWIRHAGPWDVGLAPLADSPFNAAKSPIKTLDYAALGLAVLASGVPAYRGSLADGHGGQLVENTDQAWYAALSRMVRDDDWRSALAAGGLAHLRAGHVLAVHERWTEALSPSPRIPPKQARATPPRSRGRPVRD